MRESSIEQAVIKKFQKRGFLTPKISDNPGWPDRLLVGPNGIVVFVEFKRSKGGLLSERQKVMCEKLAAMGHNVFVVADSGNEVVEEICEKAGNPTLIK